MIAPSSPRDEFREIGRAVLIAVLSAVAAGFVQWGIDTLKERCKEDEDDDEEMRL